MRRWLALFALVIAWWPALARADDRIRLWHAWRDVAQRVKGWTTKQGNGNVR